MMRFVERWGLAYRSECLSEFRLERSLRLLAQCFVVALVSVLAVDLFGAEIIEQRDFSSLIASASKLQWQCPVDRTLIVTDIDNTLLSMNQDLGSEAWFQWQSQLLRDEKNHSVDGALVVRNFEELLHVHQLLFSLSSMHATDRHNASTISALQSRGYPVIAMTSRSFEIQDVTFRELQRNNYSFLSSAIGPKGGYAGSYYPYELRSVWSVAQGDTEHEADRFYLSDVEAKRWGVGPAKKIVFQNGVVFGDGQHKGVLLRSLLAKTGFHPCALVFIDDSLKNVENMREAFVGEDVQLILIRYSFMDDVNQNFWNRDKTQVTNQWVSLKATLDAIFHVEEKTNGRRVLSN